MGGMVDIRAKWLLAQADATAAKLGAGNGRA
jgi:hypothetical protein